MKEKSQRQVRVERLIREEVSNAVIRDLSGFLPTPVSIVSVDVSKDLRHANVFFSCVDMNADVDEVKAILKQAAPHLNKSLGKVLQTKYTPRLRFTYDDSFDYAHDINTLINDKVHYSSQNLEDEE